MSSRIILIFTALLFVTSLSAQKVTRIRGKVFDAKTGEALPFVDVGLKGTNVGVSTDRWQLQYRDKVCK